MTPVTTVTAETITDEQIRALRESTLAHRRQNASTRSMRHDCDGALGNGSNRQCCRDACAMYWNRTGGKCHHGRYFGHCADCSGTEHHP